MILDLRSNPGGLLSSAVEVASDFLDPDQLIVYTEGTSPREDLLARPGSEAETLSSRCSCQWRERKRIRDCCSSD